MCGIVGYLDKTGINARTLGPTVLSMLNALGCRGPDSAGVALYGDNPDSQLVARVALSEQGDFSAAAAKVLINCDRGKDPRRFFIQIHR